MRAGLDRGLVSGKTHLGARDTREHRKGSDEQSSTAAQRGPPGAAVPERAAAPGGLRNAADRFCPRAVLGLGPAAGDTSWPLPRRGSGEPPRGIRLSHARQRHGRVRRPDGAGPGGRSHPGPPVLHLPHRLHGQADPPRRPGGRAARRARAHPGRRHDGEGQGRRDRRPLRAPARRGAGVQPFRRAVVDRLAAQRRLGFRQGQPPDAQQDVRGRQPGGHHRRQEHRRRVLRRRGRGELRRHGPARRGSGGAGALPELRPVLEQRVGVPDRGVPHDGGRPRRPAQGPGGPGRAPLGGAGLGLRTAAAGLEPAARAARQEARVHLGSRAAARRPAGEGRGRGGRRGDREALGSPEAPRRADRHGVDHLVAVLHPRRGGV